MKYIYRLGTREKDLALTRRADYFTGLSFRDSPFGRFYPTLDVEILLESAFVVRPDSNDLMTNIWTGEPYIESNYGEQLRFDEGHVSVWYPNHEYWLTWYQADLQNKGKSDLSPQLELFSKAIVGGK